MSVRLLLLSLAAADHSVHAFSFFKPKGSFANLPKLVEEINSERKSLLPEMPDIMELIEELPEFPEMPDIGEMIEESFPALFFRRRGAGGRTSKTPDKVDSSQSTWEPSPAGDGEARLVVVQITDVYTLEYFAHLKTLLEETRARTEGCKVVCMLTGDFLSPYLLSSVDRGYGMMKALANTPVDYLTWGNHEADIDHHTVCRHVRNFPGKWINSNMLDHEAMDCQQEYDVIQLTSPDGSNKRRVGLCAVLSNDPDLYSHFEDPGAFGGAHISDPWEALRKYKRILEEDEGCDMVLPLQHLYVPDDHKTCKEFDFPVILSGHDHHKVDEVVDGTRLIKPGMNGVYATVLEVSWPDASADKPTIRSRFVRTEDWEPDPVLAEECERAYDALLPLRNTELAHVPKHFEPLTSLGSRDSVCTMGKYICTHLKTSMNMSRKQRRHVVDAVLLMGGNIRGNAEYEEGSFFSLEALEAEIKSDEVVAVVAMPGWLLAKGVAETHSGEPIPGWIQYDEGVQEDYSGETPVVTHVGGIPIDHDKIYRVATKISDLTNGQCPSWTKYYTENKYLLPPKGNYVNIHAELMGYFARNIFRKLWLAISEELECDVEGCTAEDRFDLIDSDGSGVVTVGDIQRALRDLLGYSVDEEETTLARFVHAFADTNGDGTVTKRDFEVFYEEMVEENEMLPIDIPQFVLDPEEAEEMLEEARAGR
jgi:2',3'-cyclic-nucleotide 2'-phosphodiesterase (5'-nucleotidase family)